MKALTIWLKSAWRQRNVTIMIIDDTQQSVKIAQLTNLTFFLEKTFKNKLIPNDKSMFSDDPYNDDLAINDHNVFWCL